MNVMHYHTSSNGFNLYWKADPRPNEFKNGK